MTRSPIKRTGNLKSRSTTERSTLEKQADRLIQEASRLMFQGKCFKCHCEGNAGHHLVTRRNKDLRHRLMNIVYVCDTCHRFAERHETQFMNYIKNNWPVIYTWHLEHKNLPPERVTCDDLRTTIEELKQFIQTMKERRG